MGILIAIILAILSAGFYRAGGMGKEPTADPKWMPMWLRHSWCRDWICPVFSLITLLLFWHNAEWWKLLIAFICSYGLMGLAFSTYLDVIFGYDNYWASGFLVGISIFPFAIIGMSWWIVLIQAIIISVAWGLWSKYISKDSAEEMGRGFFCSIFRII